MVQNIIDDFTSPTQITTEDTPEASNKAYINRLLLLPCKNLEMEKTLSVEEKQTLMLPRFFIISRKYGFRVKSCMRCYTVWRYNWINVQTGSVRILFLMEG